jgi:hypothetical protein
LVISLSQVWRDDRWRDDRWSQSSGERGRRSARSRPQPTREPPVPRRMPLVYGAVSGSSKGPRRGTGVPPPNEDRWVAQPADGLCGVFDGHGGFGAAEFVASHLPSVFRAKLQERLDKSDAAAGQHEGLVPAVLHDAFLSTDHALWDKVKSQQRRSVACSTCRMYREKPCACTGVALPANVGSTGSLIHVRCPTGNRSHACTSIQAESDADCAMLPR